MKVRSRRLVPLILVGVLAVGTAAAGASPSPRTAGPAAGFLPEATPVRVRAPDVRITDLIAIAENRPIDLAGGKRSPSGSQARGGTCMLRFARIELDQVTLGQNRAGFTLRISDAGVGATAASIGGTGGTVELWGVLRSLKVCLPGSPCTDVRPLIPLLPALVESGRLPRVIRGEDLDIDVYALRARAPAGDFGLRLPGARVRVSPR